MIAIEISNAADPFFNQWQKFVFDRLASPVCSVAQRMILWQFGRSIDERQVNVDLDPRPFRYRQRLAGFLNYLVVFEMWNQESTQPRSLKRLHCIRWLHSRQLQTAQSL